MIKERELLSPKSGVSSKRYVGLQSFRLLAILAIASLSPYEIPASNISLLNNIAFTLGGVVIGVFIGTSIEKKQKQNENNE